MLPSTLCCFTVRSCAVVLAMEPASDPEFVVLRPPCLWTPPCAGTGAQRPWVRSLCEIPRHHLARCKCGLGFRTGTVNGGNPSPIINLTHQQQQYFECLKWCTISSKCHTCISDILKLFCLPLSMPRSLLVSSFA